MTLTDLYADPRRAVITAHRGWSARYPENTIHDATLDRTTDGAGPVGDRTLAELERLTAAFWHGPHDTGRRSASPSARESIPTLAATLDAPAGRVGLNVQVLAEGDAVRSLERGTSSSPPSPT